MVAGQYGFNCAAFRSMPSSNFAGLNRPQQILPLVSARSSALEFADAEHTAVFAPRKFMIPARSRLRQAEQCRM
jgi:hypothetical protein